MESRVLPLDLYMTLQGVKVTVKAGAVVCADPEAWKRIENKMPIREALDGR